MSNSYLSELKNVSILTTGLFEIPDSNMFHFCYTNDIKTIEELFIYVEKHGIEFDNRLINFEIEGIVKILKYKYLFQESSIINLLNLKYIKTDKRKYLNLRKLGLTRRETRLFISFAEQVENELSLGELMSLFILNFDEYSARTLKENMCIFKNKVSLLVDYYDKNKKIYTNVQILQNLYSELSDEYNNRKSNDKEIKKIKTKIQTTMDELAIMKNEEQILTLRKKNNRLK